MMSLRRISEKTIESKNPVKFLESDIMIKSDLFEVTILKSDTIIENIKKLYDLMDFSKGDFITISHGMYEITIISNEKFKEKIKNIFPKEKIIKIIDDLSSLTIKIPTQAVSEVGYFYTFTKALNWENINIVEIVSTFTELTFILDENEIPHAFSTIKNIIKNKSV